MTDKYTHTLTNFLQSVILKYINHGYAHVETGADACIVPLMLESSPSPSCDSINSQLLVGPKIHDARDNKVRLSLNNEFIHPLGKVFVGYFFWIQGGVFGAHDNTARVLLPDSERGRG